MTLLGEAVTLQETLQAIAELVDETDNGFILNHGFALSDLESRPLPSRGDGR